MATIQDLAKWAYEIYGKSADFRKSELWSALDPLINSPFVPKEWKDTVENLAEEGQKTIKDKTQSLITPFENRFGQDTSEENILNREPPDAEIIYDYLEAVEEPIIFSGVSLEDFKDNTAINYDVFFQE
jgi:hypothetical protein